MSLRVLHPGTFSILVDRGRPSTRGLGIPFGGPADLAAFQIGNALIGNPPDAVALEITLSGPTVQADTDVSCCVFGAPFAIQIRGEWVPAGKVFALRSGETLSIGGTRSGARGYLCVRGGFHTRAVLGSGAAFQPITAGESLQWDSTSEQGRSLEHADVDSLFGESSNALRVIAGPQADWFAAEALFQQMYVVSPSSNRMGVRLQGQPLVRGSREMISEAVAPGAVQITNEGLPIVLGVDGQTIGGYPKIAHVIQADLDRLGQLRPGQSIFFEQIDIGRAEELAHERRRRLKTWLTALRIFSQP